MVDLSRREPTTDAREAASPCTRRRSAARRPDSADSQGRQAIIKTPTGRETGRDATRRQVERSLNHLALSTLNCCEQDPWDVYVPRARVHRGQQITLAQHRQHKREIVNIQCLSVDRSQIKGLLETISQLSNPIFPRLLDSYYDMNQLYLVWEPIDITVDNILTAPWPINETELACVVCSTLDGIRFLRDQGRALATLGPDTVWLRKRGQGYSIQMSGMNADTLKSTARATVMRSLMATGAGHGRWSSEAQTFLENLPVKSLDVLMKASL
ncbi:hypothetical protein CBS147323_11126 [Aspergillus niger]|nr:hypothetical protein CBS13152_11418 [Aspergillus niger]KAI2867921.1 hypothetical protein CBS11852_11415 [Aspergillus niger]KAI2948034.1 hypothetical protein CBS147323_11126 [Aspergillus niger]